MSDIKVSELKQMQRQLDADLSQFINERIKQFESETGVNVAELYISSIDTTQMGDTSNRYIYHVTTKLDIN